MGDEPGAARVIRHAAWLRARWAGWASANPKRSARKTKVSRKCGGRRTSSSTISSQSKPVGGWEASSALRFSNLPRSPTSLAANTSSWWERSSSAAACARMLGTSVRSRPRRAPAGAARRPAARASRHGSSRPRRTASADRVVPQGAPGGALAPHLPALTRDPVVTGGGGLVGGAHRRRSAASSVTRSRRLGGPDDHRGAPSSHDVHHGSGEHAQLGRHRRRLALDHVVAPRGASQPVPRGPRAGAARRRDGFGDDRARRRRGNASGRRGRGSAAASPPPRRGRGSTRRTARSDPARCDGSPCWRSTPVRCPGRSRRGPGS